MSKYVAIKSAHEIDNYWGRVSATANVAIIVDDTCQPQKTGLIDKNGTPIYRVPDSVSIGYCK